LLPALAAGRLRIAMGLSEPEAGSDLMSLKARARRDGDDWIVRGQKVFTTGADTADYVLALVRSDPDSAGSRGLSVILVPTSEPGVEVAPLRKLAGQATHTCEVFMDDVRVPADAMLGKPGTGAQIMLAQLDFDRVYTAAQSLGTAQGAFDLALTYAKGREQFGVPIIQHQAIGHMLVDMKLQIDAARLLTWRAAQSLDRGLAATSEAAAAKIMASEAATRCASDGMQILGGYSYIVESGMERFYREAKIQEIFAGTNQILRNVMARQLN
jgi:alkylation response protein AidB-like acyl-CoA dehydrogenase